MSLKGPCLCGDPYCPSCGSPGAQDELLISEWLAEILEDLTEKMEDYFRMKMLIELDLELIDLFNSNKVSDTFREAMLTEATRHFDKGEI